MRRDTLPIIFEDENSELWYPFLPKQFEFKWKQPAPLTLLPKTEKKEKAWLNPASLPLLKPPSVSNTSQTKPYSIFLKNWFLRKRSLLKGRPFIRNKPREVLLLSTTKSDSSVWNSTTKRDWTNWAKSSDKWKTRFIPMKSSLLWRMTLPLKNSLPCESKK